MGIKKAQIRIEHYSLPATSTNDDVSFSTANMEIIFEQAKKYRVFLTLNVIKTLK